VTLAALRSLPLTSIHGGQATRQNCRRLVLDPFDMCLMRLRAVIVLVDLKPSDQTRLSEAPKVERVKSKYVLRSKDDEQEQDVTDQVCSQAHSVCLCDFDVCSCSSACIA
jgi:hypothetical protein